MGLAFLLAQVPLRSHCRELGAMMESMDVSQDEGFEPLEYACR